MSYYMERIMEATARNILKEYDPELLATPKAIPIENIIQEKFGLSIEYQYIRNNGRILGETVFDDTWVPIYDKEKKEYNGIYVKRGTILIDASLHNTKNDGRLRFTCAHELGHWVRHQELYNGSGKTAAMTEIKRSSEDDVIIERQADIFSSAILMPSGQVKMAFHRFARLSSDPVSELAKLFDVSKQAMEIRIKSFNLV